MENPIVEFEVNNAGETFHCKAIMHDRHYDIIVNDKSIASIEHTENCNWKQISDTGLSQTLIDDIGSKIEAHTC